MKASSVFVLALSLSVPVLAQTTESSEEVPVLSNRQESFGAVLMPPAIPAAATAAYGFIGLQEVGGGYRQGLRLFELEARARFNYFHLSLGVDGVLKYRLLQRGRLELAPTIALGVGFNSGSRYIDVRNFNGLFAHVEPGVTFAYRIHDTLRGFALLNVPVDIGLAPAGGYRFMALVGGGVEFYLGDDVSVMVLGALGPDVMRQPNGFNQLNVGYSVKLGVGYRIF